MKTTAYDCAILELKDAIRTLQEWEQELPGSVAEDTFEALKRALEAVQEDKRFALEQAKAKAR